MAERICNCCHVWPLIVLILHFKINTLISYAPKSILYLYRPDFPNPSPHSSLAVMILHSRVHPQRHLGAKDFGVDVRTTLSSSDISGVNTAVCT